MEDEELPLDATLFMAMNTNSVEIMLPDVIRDLGEMHEDWVHAKLLQHMYDAEEFGGISINAFQNMAAGAILLLAIERKKEKKWADRTAQDPAGDGSSSASS
jgi:hypothetical protein